MVKRLLQAAGVLFMLSSVMTSCSSGVVEQDRASPSVATPADAAPTTESVDPTPEPTEAPTPSPASQEPAPGLPAAAEAFPIDKPVLVEIDTSDGTEPAVWEVTIGSVYDARGVIGDRFERWPPPSGWGYGGFDVSFTLLSAGNAPQPLAQSWGWQVIGGATGETHTLRTAPTERLGCPSGPGATSIVDSVFAPGTLGGWDCMPLPVEDLASPHTQIVLWLVDEVRFLRFAPGGQAQSEVVRPAIIAGLESDNPEPGSLGNPDNLANWTLTIEAPFETDDPAPEDDTAYLAFDMTARLDAVDGAQGVHDLRSVIFQVYGGATNRVFTVATIEQFGCAEVVDFLGFALEDFVTEQTGLAQCDR